MTALQGDLPLAPDEVLVEWLKPYAEMLGWPPSPDPHGPLAGRWRGILIQKPVAFWSNIHWQLECGPLEPDQLESASWATLQSLRDAHVFGVRNPYSEITDGKQRLAGIMECVFKTGCIPSAILLFRNGSTFSVIDGHHRLVAYFMNRDVQFRHALPSGVAEFDPSLRKWIGSLRDGV